MGGSGVGQPRGFPSVFALRAWVPSAADWKGKSGGFFARDKARPAAPAPAGPGAQGGRWQGERAQRGGAAKVSGAQRAPVERWWDTGSSRGE